MSYRPNTLKQVFHTVRRYAAKKWLSLMPAVQIAITGSQGKTNTASTLYHVLSGLASVKRTGLDLDTIYNIPITSLKIRPWTGFAVFELGVDHVGEMNLHLEIVRPKIAIITGISPVHTDKEHLGSFENLIREKRKLIEGLPQDGFAVLNGDDDNVREMARYTKAKVIFYGNGSRNDITSENVKLTLKGIEFSLRDKFFVPSQPRRLTGLKASLVGMHHIYNIMASYAVYRILGYESSDKFRRLLAGMTPLTGRMSVEKGPLGTILINDSLRANPASTASGLETVSLIHTDSNKIAILAEMGELEYPEEEHAKIGRMLGRLDIDYVVALGPLHHNTVREAIMNGFPPEKIRQANGVKDASALLRTFIKKDDLLYVKGSLLRHVERVLMLLNGDSVICEAVTCPFYHHCPQCTYLLTGYTPES